MEFPLRTEELTKIYNLGPKKGKKTAVDSLSIEVQPGTIFGFLGPNGAGKTTTIKMVLDFVHPCSGKALVFGNPTTSASTRKLVGYLPEQPYFHKFLKPIEIVSMHAALAGVKHSEIQGRSMRALERARIAEYSHTPISKLSKGLTQRVGIAQAIVGDPQLLIMDEPTSGLDPIGRRHVRDLILELKAEGKTVFLSSHLLSEIENVCDTVAVLRSGKLVACGTPEVIRSGGAFVRVQTIPIDKETADRFRFLDVRVEPGTDATTLIIDPNNVYAIMRAMEEMSLPLIKISTERESLEEAFLRLAA